MHVHIVLSESVNMLNRRQQWRRMRPRVVLRTRVPDDITCVSAATYVHVHVLVARKMRLSWNTTVHFRQIPSAKDIPEAEKAKLWWSHEDLQGFALEELNRQRPDRPSVSKQASKQAQQRNNLDVAHACFEERMPRSSSSAVSERLLPALPAMGI